MRLSHWLMLPLALLPPLLGCSCEQHQSRDLQGRVDEYLAAQEEVNHFMGSVLIARDGVPLFRKGFGPANIEHDVPNTAKTKFRLGSLTKQFTAAAVLLLQEEGLLDVRDPIGKHIVDPPESWADISIHHLLTHTSGIPDFTSFTDYTETWMIPSRPDKTMLRFRNKALDFPPGEKLAYSNSNYTLLAMIIEYVSGMRYEEFLRKNIFTPLDMKDSGHDAFAAVLKHRASGYVLGEDGPEHAPYCDMDLPIGGGDLYSTVDDLLKWDQALYTDSLLSDKSRKAMFTPIKSGYAYGWGVTEMFGRVIHSHGGGINGFASQIIRFPEEKATVIILCNQESSPAMQAGRDLAAILFGRDYKLPGRGMRGDAPRHPYIHTELSESKPFDTVSKDGLMADIDYYLSIIDQAHGDPYRQVTKESLRAKAARVKQDISDLDVRDVRLIDAYFFLQEVAAFMEDEHTSVYYNQTWDEHWPTVFPLKLKMFGQGVFVTQDLSRSGLPKHAELLEIDGRSMKELIGQCRKFTNQTLPHFKRQVLERNFGKWLQTHFKISAPWKIKYRFDGQERIIEISAVGIDEFQRSAQSESRKYRESALDVNGEKIPVLTIPRFYYDDRDAYDEFMEGFFNRHADKKAIVIDLRKNGGGDGRWAMAVLDHLTDSPYLTWKRFDFKISEPFVKAAKYSRDRKYYRKGIPRLLWWLPRWLLGEEYWMDKVDSADIGEFAIERDSYHTPDAAKSAYPGKVYLLISNDTNSAAVVFAAIFAHQKMGTIIGRETGGRTVFTSDSIQIELPHSHLRVWIPVAILALPGDDANRGVLPDVEVEYTENDHLTGRDKDLEKVRELIKGAPDNAAHF